MQNLSETAVQASMTKLMKKFNTVFSDELSETPMKVPAVKIHLKDNAKLFNQSIKAVQDLHGEASTAQIQERE